MLLSMVPGKDGLVLGRILPFNIPHPQPVLGDEALRRGLVGEDHDVGGADVPLLRPVLADVQQAVFDLLQEGEDVARRAAGEVKEGRPQRASRLPVAVGHVPDLRCSSS